MSDQPTPTDKPASIAAGYFADDVHALKVGLLAGTFMRAGVITHLQTDDSGNYTSKMMIELPALEEMLPPTEVWIKVLSGPGAL